MQRMIGFVLCAVLCLWTTRSTSAAVYYVDFSAGKDAGDGVSIATAWKHAPGDPAATDAPATAKLAAGDVIKFKGGVVYKGNVVCKWSGEKGNPVTYDGNIDGKWGTGKAIIDGSEKLTGWTACASADDCGGNPNWKSISWTFGPAGVSMASVNLNEDGKFCYLSQEPKQPNPFFMERVENFYTIPANDMTLTSTVDPKRLDQKDEHYWDDASVIVWTTPNVAISRKITGFVPAENKITFEALPGPPYTDREERYTIYNSLHTIGRPGEYCFSDRAEADGRHKIYLWPGAPGDLNARDVTVSVRENGFDLPSNSAYVTIDGYVIRLFASTGHNSGIGVRAVTDNGRATGIVVRNNTITHVSHLVRGYGGIFLNAGTDCLIEGNEILDNPGGMGILVTNGINVTVKNNVVRNPGAQGIWFMGCKESQIVGNTVAGAVGTHANGISVYLKSSDILIAGNKVTDSNIPFTMEDSKHVTIACNIFDGGGKNTVCTSWGGVEDVKVFNNVLIHAGSNVGLAFVGEGKHPDSQIAVKNNIIGGFSAIKGADVSNNLYIAKHWVQTMSPGETLEEDLTKIFVAPETGDYHLKPGSPAIAAGVDVGVKVDLDGKPFPVGKAPDIGAYEHE